MNAKAKKILYGSLLAGSTALLVPTVLDGRGEAPAPPPEVPAEGPVALAEDEGEAGVARAGLLPTLELSPTTVQPAGEAPDGAGGVERAQAHSGLSSELGPGLDPELDPGLERAELEALASRSELVDSLEQSLGLLENFGPAAALPDLDRLATSWGGPAVDVDPQEGEGTALVGAGYELQMSALLEFLSANPVNGIIRGESGAMALVGGRIVELGDELFPGAAVATIEARALVVRFHGEDVRVELPPVRPRSRPGSSEQASGSAPDEGESTTETTTPQTTTEGSDA